MWYVKTYTVYQNIYDVYTKQYIPFVLIINMYNVINMNNYLNVLFVNKYIHTANNNLIV